MAILSFLSALELTYFGIWPQIRGAPILQGRWHRSKGSYRPTRSSITMLGHFSRILCHANMMLTGKAALDLLFFEMNSSCRTVIRLKPNVAGQGCLYPMSEKEVELHYGASQPALFSFDRILAQASTQADMYHEVSRIVEAAVDGRNGSILAYGQVSCCTATPSLHKMYKHV